MKKQILVLAALFAGSASIAQVTTLKNKKGFEILPQKGDYAIQIDATPILDFGLNVVKMGANGTQTAAGTFTGTNGTVNTRIVGKYFLENNMAVRGVLGINTSSTKFSQNIAPLGTSSLEDDLVYDSTSKFTQIVIGGGLEWRRGHNRLQGFYGGEASLIIGSQFPTYKEEISTDIETAATDYGVNNITTQKGSSFGFGLRGFVGVEYFVLPKISVGGEAGIGLAYSSGKVTSETTSYTTEEVVTETETKAPRTFGFNSAYSANMFITFHF